jgi:phosphoribosylformylglycinamidine cyclo-ligase
MTTEDAPKRGEYAEAGVDYSNIKSFKDAMVLAGKQTLEFPDRHDIQMVTGVRVSHAAMYRYLGGDLPIFLSLTEGLGNLNYIAEWMYQNDPEGPTYYDRIARACALIIAIDMHSHGGEPFLWTDEVAAGQDSWFADYRRATDYARGCVDVCRELGVCLGQGESPALKYLVNTLPPVKHAPTLSGSMTGIIRPRTRLITGELVKPGDVILGAPTPYLHANGISALIRRALGDPDPDKRRQFPGLPDGFFAKLPNGRTLGDEALQPMVSYQQLLALLHANGVKIHGIVPGTGGGIAKLAVDDRDYTYRLHSWPELPIIMQFMGEIGMLWEDVATTFNCGVGMYIIVPRSSLQNALDLAEDASLELLELGVVEDGPRQVVFEATGYDELVLPPPGH